MVRWSDCDAAGIAYFAVYYSFQEVAALDFLRSHDTTWGQLGKPYGAVFPRVESHCRHVASCTYGDTIDIGIHVTEMTRKIVTLAFRIWKQPEDTLLCEGYVKFAMVVSAGESGRPRAMVLPDEVRALFGDLA